MMKQIAKDKDPEFIARAMTILGNTLSRADNADDLGRYMTAEIRNITGAKCVLLVECLSNAAGAARRVMGVDPPERREWAESQATERLCGNMLAMSEPRLLRREEPSEAAGVLRQEGFELSIYFPLNARAFRAGGLLVFGLPDEEHIYQAFDLLRNLSVIAAMALQNAFLYEKQEQFVEERTAGLQDSNQKMALELAERKQADEALSNAYEYIRQLIASANVMIIGLDAAGRVKMFNKAAEKITGYSIGELAGKDWFEKVVPRDRYTWVWDMFRNYQQKTGAMPETFENPILTKSGEERFISWQNSTITIPVTEISTLSFGIDITERKKMETALSMREAELNESQRLAHIGSWDWDTVNDTIWWSDEYYRIYGLNPGGLTPNYAEHLKAYTPASAEQLNSAVKRAMETGEPYELDLELAEPTASTQWIVARGESKRDENGNILGLRGTAQNITERKRAEEELQRLILRNELILNSAGEGIYGTDIHGNILFVNQAAAGLLGFRFEELINRNSHQFFHHTKPDGTPYPVEDCPPLHKSLAGEERGEGVIRTRDGRMIHVEYVNTPLVENDRIVGAVVVFRDITERKKADEAIRRAGAYHRRLIEASLDPLVTIGPDGKITDVNSSTERATGYGREKLIGTDFSDYFTEPDKARAGYQQVFREGMVQDYALEIRHRDGHATPVLYNASVYRDEKDRIAGVFAAARDITELKRMEEDLRRINEELDQRVKERTGELEKRIAEIEDLNKLFVGRELRMIELKNRIREMETELKKKAA